MHHWGLYTMQVRRGGQINLLPFCWQYQNMLNKKRWVLSLTWVWSEHQVTRLWLTSCNVYSVAQSRFSGSHHKSNGISCPPFYGLSLSVKINHHTLLWGLRSPWSISPSTLPYYAWGDWLTLSILTRPRATYLTRDTRDASSLFCESSI